MTFIEKPAIAIGRMNITLRFIAPPALLILGVLLSGCSSGSTAASTSTTHSDPPQTYMASYMVGDNGEDGSPGYALFAYQIDDAAQTFSKSTYYIGQVDQGLQQGARTYYAGTTAELARGLLSLDGNYEYANGQITTYSPAQTGSWAIQLPNQAGGLVQLVGGPVEPIVAASTCPDFKTAQTYQFITLPAPFPEEQGVAQTYTWDPTQEALYGSVDVSGSGSTVTFNNIQQYAAPNLSTTQLGPFSAPVTPYTVTSPMTGACTAGYYGHTTIVPGNLSVTDPGPGTDAPPVAVVAIGPSGLLVESNAADGENTQSNAALPLYENLLGAGTGAIGLPKPSSALSTSTLVGAQYQGFFYGSGSGNNDWSSYVASFGFSTLPKNCTTITTQTSTMIYGGDFTGNNPGSTGAQANGGFGNCDVAIDLGAQDPNNNGLYPAATVYFGTQFAGNELDATYNFPAVVIAGQLGGTNAIFALGVDLIGTPNQAWGIYLLQSN
jgi:hypothetical protein